MSLKQFMKMAHAEKQTQNSGASPSKRGQNNIQTGTKSIEKTEYDEIIKSMQGYKMLENDLKNML